MMIELITLISFVPGIGTQGILFLKIWSIFKVLFRNCLSVNIYKIHYILSVDYRFTTGLKG